MQEIIVPSLVGALLAISWYWLMDFLPPFREARRAAAMPAAQPEAARAEAGAGIGEMIKYVVIAAALAKRQQARRIAVLQTGKARADLPALQEAVGASHEVTLVSVDEALRTRYDVLVSVGDEPGAVPGSILKVYDMNLKLEDLGQDVRIAVGTPRA